MTQQEIVALFYCLISTNDHRVLNVAIDIDLAWDFPIELIPMLDLVEVLNEFKTSSV